MIMINIDNNNIDNNIDIDNDISHYCFNVLSQKAFI